MSTPSSPILNYIIGFLLIGLAWGFTTPFIRAAARTHKPPAHPLLDSPSVQTSWFKSKLYGAFFGVVDLLRNPRYAVPLVINLTGSVWFFLLIGKAGSCRYRQNQYVHTAAALSTGTNFLAARVLSAIYPCSKKRGEENKEVKEWGEKRSGLAGRRDGSEGGVVRGGRRQIGKAENGTLGATKLTVVLELSLTVPITNSLAFLFTVLGDWYVERKVISRDTWFGMALSLGGIALCVQSKR